MDIQIAGYAHLWLDQSIDGRDYCYGAGAFGRWLQQAVGIRLRFGHEDRLELAHMGNGSLRVWEDRHGLAFAASVPSKRLPIIDREIRAGRIGCSLGGVRHLDEPPRDRGRSAPRPDS